MLCACHLNTIGMQVLYINACYIVCITCEECEELKSSWIMFFEATLPKVNLAVQVIAQ